MGMLGGHVQGSGDILDLYANALLSSQHVGRENRLSYAESGEENGLQGSQYQRQCSIL